MTTLFKKSIVFAFFIFCTINVSLAQNIPKYFTEISTGFWSGTSGIIVSVNDTSLTVRRKTVDKVVPFSNIKKMRVYDNTQMKSLSAVTAIALVGNIVYAFTIDNAWHAVLVGTVGTIGVAYICYLIYKWVNPPTMFYNPRKTPLSSAELAKKISPYLYTPTMP
jgi:hypothetical protein